MESENKPKRSRPPQTEFVLRVKQSRNVNTRMILIYLKHVVNDFNERVRDSAIIQLVLASWAGPDIAEGSADENVYQVFVQLSKAKNHQFFKEPTSIGYKSFFSAQFKVLSSSHFNCRSSFT